MIAFFRAAKNKVDWNGSCFLAGTQVVTGVDANGVFSTKSIEDLQPGDTVLARDQHDSADDLDLRPVTNVFRKTSNRIRTLTIRSDDGTIEHIQTTDDHPFFVDGRGWVDAGGLLAGDRLVSTDTDTRLEVIDATREPHPAGITVYNFEVQGDHTYFVADADTSFTNPVWVHNATGGICGFMGQSPSRSLAGQRLGSAGSGDVLGRNLKAAGVDRPTSAAAHHLVALGDSRAAVARDILSDAGIDINEAGNGMFLPINGKSSVPGLPTHSQIHTDRYYEVLTGRLTDVRGRDAVLSVLDGIRSDILANRFP